MAPPFRADHIGSLIRPTTLTSITRDPSTFQSTHLDSPTKTAIANVVKEQIDRGITPITTGEYERPLFVSGFFAPPRFTPIHHDFNSFRTGLPSLKEMRKYSSTGGTEVPTAMKKIVFEKSVYLDDWLYFRSTLPKEMWGRAKMTMPSPTFYHMYLKDGGYDHAAYSSDEEFLFDVAGVMREEIMALYKEGLRMVQIDDPQSTFLCDAEFIEAQKAEGRDVEALLDLYVRTHARLLEGLPDDLTVGVHLCRGNWPQGGYVASGGYEPIARKFLQETGYDVCYLEFDTDRAGGFEPLRLLPKDKAVVLGLVSTKFSEMEDEAKILARVMEAADVIAMAQGRSRDEVLRDNLAVSPQCGFASVSFGQGVGFDMDKMWEKLALVKRVAKKIWGEGT